MHSISTFTVRFTFAYLFFLLDSHLTSFYETERLMFIFLSLVTDMLKCHLFIQHHVYIYFEADHGRT